MNFLTFNNQSNHENQIEIILENFVKQYQDNITQKNIQIEGIITQKNNQIEGIITQKNGPV